VQRVRAGGVGRAGQGPRPRRLAATAAAAEPTTVVIELSEDRRTFSISGYNGPQQRHVTTTFEL